MTAYYNEIDPKAAAWLRELIKQGHIAPGDVDETDIRDLDPNRLDRYTQCHFFAGIGGWSLALRLAGWPDSRPVWTGSCPCQPFSAAGRRAGTADERHLWPHWHHLISQCQPAVVFGEQVASKDGLGWLDLVQADLEATGYAFAAQDICAAGVGAPHIRQRLWFVGLADADNNGRRQHWDSVGKEAGKGEGEAGQRQRLWTDTADGISTDRLADAQHHDGRTDKQGRRPQGRAADGRSSTVGRLADAECEQRQRWRTGEKSDEPGSVERTERLRDDGRLGDTNSARTSAWLPEQTERHERHAEIHDNRMRGLSGPDEGRPRADGVDDRPSPTNGHWRDADWLFCRDGKWRPVEPGTFPLAHGLPARVGRLRGYGNAIVPQVAATWIEAVMQYEEGRT